MMAPRVITRWITTPAHLPSNFYNCCMPSWRVILTNPALRDTVSARGNMLKTLSIISVQMVGPPLFF